MLFVLRFSYLFGLLVFQIILEIVFFVVIPIYLPNDNVPVLFDHEGSINYITLFLAVYFILPILLYIKAAGFFRGIIFYILSSIMWLFVFGNLANWMNIDFQNDVNTLFHGFSNPSNFSFEFNFIWAITNIVVHIIIPFVISSWTKSQR